MRFRVLGPLEVRDGKGIPVPLHAPKQRALLTVLLLYANQPVSTRRLEVTLWPDKRPRSADGVVRTYISGLRSALGLSDDPNPGNDHPSGPKLAKEPDGYRLTVEPGDLDLAVFDELNARGADALRHADIAEAARLLADALALWRGEPAADVELDGDAGALLAALVERRLAAEEAWADTQLALGSGTELIGRLRTLVAEQPLREGVCGQLMLAMYRAGRTAEALAEFRALRDRMTAELGVEPSAALQRLHRQMLAGDAALAPPPPSRLVPRQLPRDTGDFTGRAGELTTLTALEGREGTTAPVITVITGTAGCGKTALAVHFAHRVADRFPDGQLCVDLQAYADIDPMSPAEALRRFLRALFAADVPADIDEAAALYRSLLADKRALILLDNAATAGQVRPLLPASSGCLVLVTSRSRLPGLVARDSAAVLPIGPLPELEGVQLLRKILGNDRVQAEPAAAAAIVARCAGLPLALRVAAERAAHRPRLPLTQLAAELGAEKHRLDVLTAGADGDTTVRSVFSGSYRSLSPDAARLFRLLGLHPGRDISVAAAAALTGGTLIEAARLLEVLAGSHLIEEAAAGRYRLHDLLRAYAAERAADDEDDAERAVALRRVLTWYLHAADAADRRIGPTRRRVPLGAADRITPPRFAGYDEAVAWCDAEQANLEAAVIRAAEAGLTDIAWKIPAALGDFFRLRRPWTNWMSCTRAGLAAARRAGDIAGQAWSLNDLGSAYLGLASFAAAAKCYEEALRLVRQTGDRQDESAVLNNLAATYWELSRTGDALLCFRQSLTLARETGNRHGECIALDNLGEAYRRTGRPGQAIPCHRQALRIAIATGDHQGEGQALHNLGEAYRMLQRNEESHDCYLHALMVRRQAGDRQGEAETLRGVGDLAFDTGTVADACAHWRQALAIFEALGDPQADDLRPRLHGPLSSPG